MKKGISWGLVLVLCISMAWCMVACEKPVDDAPAAPQAVPLANHATGAVYAEREGAWQPSKKKAILFVPGLMASSLFEQNEDGTETNVWGFKAIGDLYIPTLLQSKDPNVLMDKMRGWVSCDADCVPLTKMRVANMNDHAERKEADFVPDWCRDGVWTDAWNGMSSNYTFLRGYRYNNTSIPVKSGKDYADEYDMVVWQYDWRQHLEGTGEQLRAFIDGCGYEKVMFFTHSMGGLAVANYLALGEECRNKVELFVPFGAPFLGSMDTATNLCGVAEGVDEKQEDMNMLELLGAMVDDFIGVCMKQFGLEDIARNLASVYQMLPNNQFNQNNAFGENEGAVVVDGKVLTTEELIAFFGTFDWAKDSTGMVKAVLGNLQAYQNKFYVDGKHISTLVPTEYVLGAGVETLVGVTLNKESGQIIRKQMGNGDGTVPFFSATAGTMTDQESAYNVHVEMGISHGPIANNYALDNTASKDYEAIMQAIMERFERGVAGKADQE